MARSKDEMTIVEHLVEFRRRFIAVVLCFFLVFCVTLLFAGELYAYLTRGFDKHGGEQHAVQAQAAGLVVHFVLHAGDHI